MEDNLVKMSVIPKLINKVKIPLGLLVEIDKQILNFKQKYKRPRIANKKNEGGRLTLPGLKTNYKYIMVKYSYMYI